MNKKAVSGVVTAVIMVALVMGVSVIVWVVINNVIEQQIGGVESCFGLYEKVILDNQYTCYDDTLNRFQFSISIKDVDIDKVIVSISSAGTTNSYTLTNEEQTIEGLTPYPSGSGDVVLPDKNGGLTYITDIETKPDTIRITPVVGGKQCEVSDSLSEIDNCLSLA